MNVKIKCEINKKLSLDVGDVVILDDSSVNLIVYQSHEKINWSTCEIDTNIYYTLINLNNNKLHKYQYNNLSRLASDLNIQSIIKSENINIIENKRKVGD